MQSSGSGTRRPASGHPSPWREIVSRYIDVDSRLGGSPGLTEERREELASELRREERRQQRRVALLLTGTALLTLGVALTSLLVASRALEVSAAAVTVGWVFVGRDVRFRAEVLGKLKISLDLVRNGSLENVDHAFRAVLSGEAKPPP